MPRAKTKSFITEVPIKVTSQQEQELLARFQAGRQLYNACLNESMVRMNLVRNSAAYQKARKIPKDQARQRSKAFQKAREA